MQEAQSQKVSNNSNAIQVHGDLNYGLSYSDVKQIFYDLFKMNFPEIQEIARKEADSRVNKLIEKIEKEFNEKKDNINNEKFKDPNIQYEMTQLAINAARFGEKSNLELLAKLFTLRLENDCPEVIEQISGEALKILPLLSKVQLSILVIFILSNEAELGEKALDGKVYAKDIDKLINNTQQYLTPVLNMKDGDIAYLQCINCLNTRPITQLDLVPNILRDVVEFKGKKLKEIKELSKINNYNNITSFLEFSEKCYIGRFYLSVIGRLLGWLSLQKISNINIKELF
ncbi:MAG: LPO_1073/Vpar_1526 family protein [Treponema sp.]|nr:LPO_1073/Vpar_1526 family protein [Treponema sp.]